MRNENVDMLRGLGFRVKRSHTTTVVLLCLMVLARGRSICGATFMLLTMVLLDRHATRIVVSNTEAKATLGLVSRALHRTWKVTLAATGVSGALYGWALS